MTEIEFQNFIQKGDQLAGIFINDTLEKVIKTLGDPTERVGDNAVGFLYFKKGIRLGYFDDIIDELCIEFQNTDITFLETNNFGEKIIISSKTQIHAFIYFLNTNNIVWKCIDEKNISAFMININNITYAFFDLYTGCLLKVFIHR